MNMLQIIADPSFRGDYVDLKATSGKIIAYKNSPIFRCTWKQTIMAISTAEESYLALSSSSQHTQVIERLFIDSHIMADGPCAIIPNNQAVRLMLKKLHSTKRLKFIDIRHQLLTHLIKHIHFRSYACTWGYSKSIHVHQTAPEGTVRAKMTTLNISHLSTCRSVW